MIKLIVPLTLCATLTACASITQDKNQPVKVETITASGDKVEDAKCLLKNDRGEFHTETPKTVLVRKSAGDLIITCQSPNHPSAEGKLVSRTGAAVFGNIIFGGVIGGVLDTASGVAFNYPEWVQLVFGKSLTFDRHHFKDNTLQVGVEGNTEDKAEKQEKTQQPAQEAEQQPQQATEPIRITPKMDNAVNTTATSS